MIPVTTTPNSDMINVASLKIHERVTIITSCIWSFCFLFLEMFGVNIIGISTFVLVIQQNTCIRIHKNLIFYLYFRLFIGDNNSSTLIVFFVRRKTCIPIFGF